MISKNDIAAVVVIYNPPLTVLDNIQTYSHVISRLFVVDNSEICSEHLVEKLKEANYVYINNNGNMGIARALNIGVEEASRGGYRWLLTMDQDTKLPTGYLETLIGESKSIDERFAGIIAPDYGNSFGQERSQEVLFTMTSGNLLNIEICKKVNGFLEELFIDHVDHEFGLRLNRNGFKVVQLNALKLSHHPGERNYWGKVKYVTHSPLRLYYFSRNGFYVSEMYKNDFPQFKKIFIKLLMKEVFKIFVLQSSKLKRLRMLFKGYRHYRQKNMGKYSR